MTPLAAALAYIARGRAVLHLEAGGKRPTTPHGVYDASVDADVIRGWWGREPDGNVGLPVGVDELVVDVDPRNGGTETLATLVREHGQLPPTVEASTGSGGRHLLYRLPASTRTRGKLGLGIDLLRAGRYIVASPSVTVGPYRWVSPRGTPTADAPAWLVDLATPTSPPAPLPLPRASSADRVDVVERARRYVAACPPAISGSSGHTTTFLLAARLTRGFGLAEATALALMIPWNRTCLPPWSTRELARKVQEAARAGQMAPGCLLDARRSA